MSRNLSSARSRRRYANSTPAFLLLLSSFTVPLHAQELPASDPAATAPSSTASPPPAVAAPASAPPAAPGQASPSALEQTGWLRAGAGIGSFALQSSGITFSPGLFGIAEVCPSGGLCFFGSLRGTATTYPSNSGFGGGSVIGSTPVAFTTSSLVSLALSGGARYVLTPGAPVEISPWLSLGVGGGFAEGAYVSAYDPIIGGPISGQIGMAGVDTSATVGVLAEREVWDGVRVRVSTSLLNGSMTWSNVWAGGASGTSALHFGVDLVLRPSVGVLLEL